MPMRLAIPVTLPIKLAISPTSQQKTNYWIIVSPCIQATAKIESKTN
jgi:hypothetical protein